MSILFNSITVTLRPENFDFNLVRGINTPWKRLYAALNVLENKRGSHQGKSEHCPPQHCSGGVSLSGYQGMMILCQSSNQYRFTKSESEVTQSCPTLCNPMDFSLPGFSVHGFLQARVLEWVTISFSGGSSRPRDRTRVSCIGGRRFNLWATREAPGSPKVLIIWYLF